MNVTYNTYEFCQRMPAFLLDFLETFICQKKDNKSAGTLMHIPIITRIAKLLICKCGDSKVVVLLIACGLAYS